MIVQPKIRGFICTTAHPTGCMKSVEAQIAYVKKQGLLSAGPKNALIIGSSTGYGLASRIVAAFGARAATLGVFFEREAEDKRTATAGWYNMAAFEKKAAQENLYVKSFNGDAFSDEIKEKVIQAIKKDLGTIDLIVYSLASPRRQHPRSGQVAKSVLKPIGQSYTNKSIDVMEGKLQEVTLPPATAEEIDQTVSVMGGEDWEYWIQALESAGVLSKGVKTVAYSYIGPEVTYPIYRKGTIGKAKEHLEATAKKLNELLSKVNGQAYISVNKAIVTHSSSAIPFVPLYFILLKKVMKENGTDEDCIAQIDRLFRTRLYSKERMIVDENGYIRMDDLEMNPEVQRKVAEGWHNVNQANISALADLEGYQNDFLKLFGFDLSDVDYNADVDVNLKIPTVS